MYKLIDECSKAKLLFNNNLKCYAIEFNSKVFDFNAPHESAEHNEKNARFTYSIFNNKI